MSRSPHRGRNGTRHIGRLRTRAAEILTKGLGYRVDPSDIHPATGSWRTCPYHDVYRWELFTKNEHGHPVVGGCWLTLTRFVTAAAKTGCHIVDGEIWPGPDSEKKEVHDDRHGK